MSYGSRLNLLDVAIAVSDQRAQNAVWSVEVARATDDLLSRVTKQSASLRAIILLATPQWCDPNRPISRYIREQLQSTLGYPVPLIGGSAPRLFVSLPHTTGAAQTTQTFEIDDGFVIIGLLSNDLWVSVDAVPDICQMPEAKRRAAIKEMAGRIREDSRKTHIGPGTSATADLFAIFPGPYECSTAGRCVIDIDIHREVLEAFDEALTLLGGASADELERPIRGYQFLGSQCLVSGLVVALFEYEFKIGSVMAHGFRAAGLPPLMVTKLGTPNVAHDYIVAELDGRPAGAELKGLAKRLPFSSPRPTLGLGLVENTRIVTPMESLARLGDGPVRMNRRVTLGYPLVVLNASDEELMTGAKKAMHQSIQYSGARRSSIRLILSFGCIGRFLAYEHRQRGGWWDAVRALTKDVAGHYPIVCALMAGEAAEIRRRRPRADNFGVWFACLTGEPNRRSENRLLQAKLLKMADQIAFLPHVTAIMAAAVDRAMKAGATGGQICICDSASGKILGAPHGYAAPAQDKDSPNFKDISPDTCRPLPPKQTTYHLTEKLKRWVMEIGPRPSNSRYVQRPEPPLDILTLVIANRIAIFVPDSTDPDFLCDTTLIQRAGINAQLVIPLLGSVGQPIATLQLGFPQGVILNRETMRTWLGYGQQVAAVLERAFEAEGRAVAESINDVGDQIMRRTPPPPQEFAEPDVVEFLIKLEQTVQADYVHLRVREEVALDDFRYRLVAPESPYSREHRAGREYIRPGEGSLWHVGIPAEMTFTKTQAETLERYRSQPENAAPHLRGGAELWQLQGRPFATYCAIPLDDLTPPTGCLVLHSCKEYFFTERRLATIRHAIPKLPAIIAKRKADYIQHQQRLITMTGLLWAKTGHDVSRPLANICYLAELLQRTTPAHGTLWNDLEKIRSQGEKAISLLRGLASQLVLPSEVKSVSGLLESAVGEMTDKWSGTIAYSAGSEQALVVANVWVHAALVNLLNNAVENIRGTTWQLWVNVGIVPDHSKVRISVVNDGTYLTDDQVRRLRMPGSSTKPNHLGLGFVLAEMGLMTAGGRLEARRRPEGGLAVMIDIPRSDIS